MSSKRNTVRDDCGVVAYFQEGKPGHLRLTFDDVKKVEGQTPNEWRKKVLFTHIDFPIDKTLELGLTQETYATIGENLVVRLLALNKRF